MATSGEIAQDMTRVLDALVQARRYVEAHDNADTARSAKDTRSPLRNALELAERAGERVHDYLSNQESTAHGLNMRDGGPL